MNIKHKRTILYEGKAKVIYEGTEPGTIIQHFKDDATAFNNKKKGVIVGKGVINNRISEYLMTRLSEIGIYTHFIRSLNMREQLIRVLDIIPLGVVVRNISAGSFCKRFGLEEGFVIGKPIIEFYAKNEALENPMVSEEHINTFGWANDFEIEEIKILAIRINDFLSGLFLGAGMRLVDFKLEFGRLVYHDVEHIVLADEISPDNCRIWDMKTNKKLDKDRFRQDLGNVEEAYMEVANRLGIMNENDNHNHQPDDLL